MIESRWGINITPISAAWTYYIASRSLSGKPDDTSMSGCSVNSVVNKVKGVRDGTCSKRGESEQYGTAKDGRVKVYRLIEKIKPARRKSDDMHHGGRLSGDTTVYHEMEYVPRCFNLNNSIIDTAKDRRARADMFRMVSCPTRNNTM